MVGGQAVQANLLLERLNRVPGLVVELIPINPRMGGPLKALQRVRYLRTGINTLAFLWSLLTRLSSFDVVHVFSASYLSFVLAPTPALAMARLFRRPTVLNYLSGEAAHHLSTWRTAPPTIRLATRVITPSDYLVEVFRDHGLEASSIPNSVDLDEFQWLPRDPLRPVFLSNRNFEAHYDVTTILEAFSGIQSEIRDARLLVVGDGPLRGEIHATSERMTLRNVEFFGRVEHSRMPEFYAEADVYLNSPYVDNMPNSILEAYACGLPVVSSNAGGIPYIVRDGESGLLVPPRDPSALARAALRLFHEPGLAASLAAQGLREVQERYAWARVRDQWVDLYRELAGKGGAVP